MEETVTRVRAGECTAKQAATILQATGDAVEGLPYRLRSTLSSLCMDLEIAQWHEDEGAFPDTELTLQQVASWITDAKSRSV